MSRFKKKKGKKIGAISTASLPDIVFMLLFFFMVATVLREVDLKITNEIPRAEEIKKLKRKSLIMHIYVGSGKFGELKGIPNLIQLDDAISEIKDIGPYLELRRARVTAENEKKLLTTSFKADKDAEMGFINEIFIELRRYSPFGHPISYTAKKPIPERK